MTNKAFFVAWLCTFRLQSYVLLYCHKHEVWEDEEAHQNSLSLDVFKELITKAKPIITGMSDYPSLIIKGGKGIR